VAIPAVVAYNLLNRRVQLITSILDRFSEEFVRCAVAASRRGVAARPASAPAAAPPRRSHRRSSPAATRRGGIAVAKRRRPVQNYETAINITSLVDVMMLLLLIFILVARC